MMKASDGSKRSDQLRVDRFIRDALAEKNLFARAKLLGKAVYWNRVAMKADPDIQFVRGKPIEPDRPREIGSH